MPVKGNVSDFAPFANEADCIAISGLLVENRIDRVALYGTLDITLDRAGLADALALQQLLARIIAAMESQDLPARVDLRPAVVVDNPFLLK